MTTGVPPDRDPRRGPELPDIRQHSATDRHGNQPLGDREQALAARSPGHPSLPPFDRLSTLPHPTSDRRLIQSRGQPSFEQQLRQRLHPRSVLSAPTTQRCQPMTSSFRCCSRLPYWSIPHIVLALARLQPMPYGGDNRRLPYCVLSKFVRIYQVARDVGPYVGQGMAVNSGHCWSQRLALAS